MHLCVQASTYSYEGCARPVREYGGSALLCYNKVSTDLEEQETIVLTKL